MKTLMFASCCLIATLSAPRFAAADEPYVKPAPGGNNSTPAPQTPPADNAVDECKAELSECQTGYQTCEADLDAAYEEIADCRGVDKKVVAEEMKKPKGQRNFKKKQPAAPKKAPKKDPPKKDPPDDDEGEHDEPIIIEGPQGPQGPQGLQGPQGPPGETKIVHVSEDAPAAQKGDAGEPGRDGRDGRNGRRVYIRLGMLNSVYSSRYSLSAVAAMSLGLTVPLGRKAEATVEGLWAPAGVTATGVRATFTHFKWGKLGYTLGLDAAWVNQEYNVAKGQYLGVNDGLTVRFGGARIELTGFFGRYDSYGVSDWAGGANLGFAYNF